MPASFTSLAKYSVIPQPHLFAKIYKDLFALQRQESR